MAALRAPSSDTHATGTPGGICTIARMASSPPSALFEDVSGTPITGRSVYAAAVPGRAAAIPAPAMITRTPRRAAVEAYSATPRGSRWADRTLSSYEIPRSFSSSMAGSMRSRSDSEPMRMPTSAPAASNSSMTGRGVGAPSGRDMKPGLQRDVGAVLSALEVDQRDGLVGTVAGFHDGRRGRGHRQNASPGADRPSRAQRRPRVEHESARRLGLRHAPDLDS